MRGTTAKFLRRDVYRGREGVTKYAFARYTTSLTPNQTRLIKFVAKIPKFGKKWSTALFKKLHKVVPASGQIIADPRRQAYQQMKTMWKSWDWKRRTKARAFNGGIA